MFALKNSKMRVGLRVAAAGGVLIILLVLLHSYKRQQVAPALHQETSTDSDDGWPSYQDKVVVVPKLIREDTDWLGPDLPE